MLTRKLDKTSRVKPTIAFYSRKNRAMMLCESRLEVDALLQLEFDVNVVKYLTQPCSVNYATGTTTQRYTPDILISYRNGTFKFLEIKPFDKAKKPKFVAKFLRLQSYFYEAIGHPLELLTDKEIRIGKSAVNLSLLYQFLDVKSDEEISETVLREAKSLERPTVADIENIFTEYGQDRACAWNLLAQKKLRYDIRYLLKRQSSLEVAA